MGCPEIEVWNWFTSPQVQYNALVDTLIQSYNSPLNVIQTGKQIYKLPVTYLQQIRTVYRIISRQQKQGEMNISFLVYLFFIRGRAISHE